VIFGALAVAIAAVALVLAVSAPRIHVTRQDVGGSLPAMLRRLVARRREARSARHLLGVLQGTHAALRAGQPMSLALRSALDVAAPEARPLFAVAMREFDLNGALDGALRASAAGAADRRVALGLEALALIAAEQLAASRAAAVLGSVCDRLAFEERLGAEIAARSGGLRAQIVLLAVLVPAIAAYLVVTVPGVGATLASSLGMHVLVPAALAFEAAGLVASRAILRSVQA
jgi:Flp pilus assembly protein TadB